MSVCSGEEEWNYANLANLVKAIPKAFGRRDCCSNFDGIMGIVKSDNWKIDSGEPP
jgi:hypothetical protein